MKRIAIVTGASSGVGCEFVRQFDAGRGGPLDEIWAIARTKNALDTLAQLCTTVPVRSLPLDLTDDGATVHLTELLEQEDAYVEWLVNSAGFGRFGTFTTMERSSSLGMIRLNCLALVDVISISLPHMHAGSRIVNLASIAGVVPQPELAVYSATKAFVYELSRMLDHELAPAGIHVTAVCPKFMRTRFLDSPGNAQVAERMSVIGFMDTSVVARKSIRAALHGRATCVPGLDMKAAMIAARLLPRRALFRIEDLLFRR